jgi:Leucine-rich repeat (LRR) protein
MRISAELLSVAEQRTNPLNERELVLQGLGIPAIENMGAARDEFDSWDLSNNRIVKLENFPRLKRLSSLLLSGNVIETIDANNMSRNVSNITSLTLSYNHISSLVEVANIGKGFPKLEFLTLVGNPVTSKYNYEISKIYIMCRDHSYNKPGSYMECYERILLFSSCYLIFGRILLINTVVEIFNNGELDAIRLRFLIVATTLV